MFAKLFLDHPASVGESYPRHFWVAGRFGLKMVIGGAGCVLHAFLPFAFKTRGSDTVRQLHAEMVAKRSVTSAAQTQMKTVDYVI